jgi:hypothetical protein
MVTATILRSAEFAWHNRPSHLDHLITVEFADHYGIRDELDTAAIAILARGISNARARRQASPLQVALSALDHDDILTRAGYAAEYSTFVHAQDDYNY